MRNDFESNYLMHHGILGMRWGRRNGPPYPLGSEDHSSSEKKAGYKKSLGGGRNESLYDRNRDRKIKSTQKHLDKTTSKLKKLGTAWDNDPVNNKKMDRYRKFEKKYYKELNKVQKKYDTKNTGGMNDYAHYQITGEKEKHGLTDEQKRAIKIGAAFVGTALVAYGGYRLVNSPKGKELIRKGMDFIKKKPAVNSNIENITNVEVMANKAIGGGMNTVSNKVLDGSFTKVDNYAHTIDKAMEGINPNYNSDKAAFRLLSSRDMMPIDKVNCVACTTTYELKARGYQGMAHLIDTRDLEPVSLMRKIYKNPDANFTAKMLNSWDDLTKEIASQGAGARGNISLPFSGGGLHNVAYEVDKSGKTWIIDCQAGKKFTSVKELSDFLVSESNGNAGNWAFTQQAKAAWLRTDNLEFNDVEMLKKLVAG